MMKKIVNEMEINAPEEGSVVGTIVKIDDVEEAVRIQLNSDAKVITVQDFEGKNHPIWFAENQISEFGLKGILFIGNVVSADVEYRVEGETEYVTPEGSVDTHTATVTGGRNCTHASEAILLIKGLPMAFCDAVTKRRDDHVVAAPQRNVNFNRMKIGEGLPTLIAELKAKAERASNAVVKKQYADKIAELELELAAENAGAPGMGATEAVKGGSAAKGKGK